jgi:hypothetical protein
MVRQLPRRTAHQDHRRGHCAGRCPWTESWMRRPWKKTSTESCRQSTPLTSHTRRTMKGRPEPTLACRPALRPSGSLCPPKGTGPSPRGRRRARSSKVPHPHRQCTDVRQTHRHPRVCGEQPNVHRLDEARGPSPQVRKAVGGLAHRRLSGGIIPAGTGMVPRSTCSPRLQGWSGNRFFDHAPRSEHLSAHPPAAQAGRRSFVAQTA